MNSYKIKSKKSTPRHVRVNQWKYKDKDIQSNKRETTHHKQEILNCINTSHQNPWRPEGIGMTHQSAGKQ